MTNDIGGKNPISKEGEGVLGFSSHLYPHQTKAIYSLIFLLSLQKQRVLHSNFVTNDN